MIARIPSWIFIFPAVILLICALFPIFFSLIGAKTLSLSFISVLFLLIPGLMAGLSGMILMLKRTPEIQTNNPSITSKDKQRAFVLHACGLLLYTPFALSNFLLCFYLWKKWRHQSEFINQQGKQALNFQVAIYLYLLLSMFLVIALFGLISTPLILALHLLCTLLAMVMSKTGKNFKYPANISVI